MMTQRKSLALGAGLGILGALGQVWFLMLNSPQTPLWRGLLSLGIAALIGVVAGLTGKKEAILVAGQSGFVAGVLLSLVGFSLLATNPALAGPQPFASVESTLLFVSSVMAGTVISSWIVAALAVVVALPFTSVLTPEKAQ